MINKVIETVNKHGMINKGDKVIVALSGGADSTVLLDVLVRLKDELELTVYAAHVNHNLRGDESLRDENFVRNLCARKNVELFVRSVDVNALCESSGESFELAGRKVRYSFFEELSEKLSAKIATAHTLSDSLETALFNIARGTSLSGLCSIPYIRGKVVRPLLDVTRDEIESYAKENSVEFVNDSTNSDVEICSRNKLRHKAVPALKEVNASAEQNFMKLRSQLKSAEDFIRGQAEFLLEKASCQYGYDCKILTEAHETVRGFALKLIVESTGVTAEYRYINILDELLTCGGALEISKGVTVLVSQGILRTVNKNNTNKFEKNFENNSFFFYSGKEYSVKELTEEEIVNKKLATFCIGCDKISLGAYFRTRESGDRFSLVKRNISKDLRKLQNELRIPSEQRDSMLLLTDGRDLLWAEGIGVSALGVYSGGNGILIEIRKDVQNA